jgi:sialidase-1
MILHKNTLVLLSAIAAMIIMPIGNVNAATENENDGVVLFHSTQSQNYRIPAIAVTPKGEIIAISDNRYEHGYDLGYKGYINLEYRRSVDDGATWEDIKTLADHNLSDTIKGYGDASIVSDCLTGKLMVMAVTDSLFSKIPGYKHGMYRFYSNDGGVTWDKGVSMTGSIYKLNPKWKDLFVTSGKIMQSRVVKKGAYYRLYCAPYIYGYGNDVIYSDDFGLTWQLLGDGAKPCCAEGDEAKVEEMPDGTIILSARSKSRFFNVYRFNDNSFVAGKWGEYAGGGSFELKDKKDRGRVCNGEILRVMAYDKKGKLVNLLLQSVPAGPDRSHVSIYYKLIKDFKDITPESLTEGWKGYEVTDTTSGYSTMCMQKDGRIAFYYERDQVKKTYSYNMVYEPLDLSVITSGEYLWAPPSVTAVSIGGKRANISGDNITLPGNAKDTNALKVVTKAATGYVFSGLKHRKGILTVFYDAARKDYKVAIK